MARGLLKRFIKDEKGLIQDIPFIIVYLFAFFIVIIFSHRAYTEVHDQLTRGGSSALFMNNTAAANALTYGQNAINGLDFIFVMVMVLLFLGLVISAFFLDTHPIFFFLFLTLFLGLIVVAAILSNTMNDILSNPTLSNESATFPLSSYVFDHYPLYIFVAIIIVSIIFYAKFRQAIG